MFKIKTAVLISAMTLSGIASADLNTGLIAYYSFNGNANDESGNGNHGIVEGAQLTTDVLGNPDSAYSFDGSSNQIVVADAPNLNFDQTSPQSISLWLYRTGAQGGMHFIGKRSGCGSDFGNYQFAFNENSGENIIYLRNNSNKKLPINKWTHLVATYDGVTAKTYMNGILFAKKETSMGNKNTAPLIIGGSGNCAHFKGSIDEARIYNRVLTNTEISMLHNQFIPVSGSVKSLAAHTVSCKNETTGQIINIAGSKATVYDCEAKGLKVNAGEAVSILIKGNAE